MAKEINGYTAKDIEVEDPKTKAKTVVAKAGEQLGSFAFLQDDGSTTCGNWIYCGSYTEEGNMAARRGKTDPTGIGLYPGWAWCWPVNRRIIYNRASVNWEGKPWNPKRAVIWWDGTKWQGDVPDGPPPPGGDLSLHHASRRPCPDLRTGPGRRAFPRTLRAPGMPHREEPYVRPEDQPDGQDLRRGRGGRGGGQISLLRSAGFPSSAPRTG